MPVEKLPNLVAVMMPRDTAEGVREALRYVDRDNPVAVGDALARREQFRLDEARAERVVTDFADWRGREWLWRWAAGRRPRLRAAAAADAPGADRREG